MARLPQPGSDHGTWGNVLNDFLSQALAADGQLKSDSVGSAQLKDNAVTAATLAPNSVTNAALASNAVTAAIIADGSITEVLLDAALQAKVNAGSVVASVAGKTGVVMLNKTDVGLGSIDNTSDADKPVSIAQQTALDSKLDRTSVVNSLYGTDGTGTQFSYTVIQGAANANTVARRTGSGAIFTATPTSSGHAATKDYVDTAMTNMVTTTGTQTLTNKTLTSPRVNQLSDLNGAPILTIYTSTSPVNNFQMSNGATGTSPVLQSIGSDTDINLGLRPKGNGSVLIRDGANSQSAAFSSVPGAVTRFVFTTSVSGAGPTISSAGPDTNIDLQLAGKGTGGVVLPSGSPLTIYNTADQLTNYERLRTYWSGNVVNIRLEAGGTGVHRDLVIGTNTRLITIANTPDSNGIFRFDVSTSAPGAAGVTVGRSIGGGQSSLAQASGTFSAVSIQPSINQSGAAGYTMLQINPTETATGSGQKLLADFQIAGATKFSIQNDGQVFMANTSVEPATPSGGGVIFIENGALKYKGSSGTVTTLGDA